MARVTVEDCIDKVKDRFELVAVAAQRARNISAGAEVTIEKNNEKNTVIALREIAADKVEVDSLREDMVRNYQTLRDMDEDVRESLEVKLTEEEEAEIARLEANEEERPEGAFEDEAELEAAAEAAEEDALSRDDGDYSFEDENIDADD